MLKSVRVSSAALLLAASCGIAAAAPPAPAPPPTTAITMKKDGGVYVVPVSVNGIVTVDAIVDSGASDVNLPAGIFRKLVAAGIVKESDVLGTRHYQLADGSDEEGRVVRIKSLKVGNIEVKDVIASIGGEESNALLGQSFLERFRSWSLDNTRHALVLVGTPSAAPPPPPVGVRPHPQDGPPSVAQSGSGSGSSHGAPTVAPPAVVARPATTTQDDGPGTVAQISGHSVPTGHRPGPDRHTQTSDSSDNDDTGLVAQTGH